MISIKPDGHIPHIHSNFDLKKKKKQPKNQLLCTFSPPPAGLCSGGDGATTGSDGGLHLQTQGHTRRPRGHVHPATAVGEGALAAGEKEGGGPAGRRCEHHGPNGREVLAVGLSLDKRRLWSVDGTSHTAPSVATSSEDGSDLAGDQKLYFLKT